MKCIAPFKLIPKQIFAHQSFNYSVFNNEYVRECLFLYSDGKIVVSVKKGTYLSGYMVKNPFTPTLSCQRKRGILTEYPVK